MSRTWNKHHPSGRSRKSRFPVSRGPWKMRPHGLQYFTGYGGEAYFRNGSGRYSNGLSGEYIFPVINKSKARREEIQEDPDESGVFWKEAWDMFQEGTMTYQEFLRYL